MEKHCKARKRRVGKGRGKKKSGTASKKGKRKCKGRGGGDPSQTGSLKAYASCSELRYQPSLKKSL